MSDLSLQLQHDPARVQSQLPVSSYFDEALYQEEMRRIFDKMPKYVGHALSVPEQGDYFALPSEEQGRALVRSSQGVQLLSNICRHRQAIMLRDRGNTSATGGNIVCPLHRWTYNTSGQLLGAPYFAEDPCLNLSNYALDEWNGLLFEKDGKDRGLPVAQQLVGMACAPDLNFEGFQFHSAKVHMCDYNWKTFIEVYLEDYHVGPFHPGLGGFVTCEDLRWQFERNWSVQTVGVADKLDKPGSDVYQRWHDAVLNYRNGEPPKHGAIWLTLYPTLMVEWYPHVLVVSNLYPMGTQKTMNVVEFFYPEEIAAFEPEFIEAQQAAYMETCVEDDEIAERMDAGRKALMDRGDNESGPYQSPMEDGMQHFHEWYRAMMGNAV